MVVPQPFFLSEGDVGKFLPDGPVSIWSLERPLLDSPFNDIAFSGPLGFVPIEHDCGLVFSLRFICSSWL